MPFAEVYPHYINKVERKGRTAAEVDAAIEWLTGYTNEQLHRAIDDCVTFREFFDRAPALNAARTLVTGSVCGVKVQEVEDPLMKLIRIMDKLVDEIAKGKAMEKVLRVQTR